MASSKRVLLFSLLLLVGLASSFAKQRPAFVGGYQPIKDLSDPYVVQVAKFAVSQHNKDADDDLVLVKVLSGQQQVVAGTNYKLTIAARHGGNGAADHYQALVYDKPWMKVRTLTSFDKA